MTDQRSGTALQFKGWASVFAELEPRLTWLRGAGCATADSRRSGFDSRPEAHT